MKGYLPPACLLIGALGLFGAAGCSPQTDTAQVAPPAPAVAAQTDVGQTAAPQVAAPAAANAVSAPAAPAAGFITSADLNPAMSATQKAILASHKNR
jgi:hypothetical protein